MTTEDQVAALFAKANPVPSLDLLDPVEPLDVSHLANRVERSSAMTDIKTDELKTEPGRRPRLALVLAMGLIGVVALGILVTRDNGVATPESVATAFIVARGEADFEAMQDLVAPEGGVDLERIRAHGEWERATGWVFTELGCEERSSGPNGALVHCPYTLTNPWFEALGLEPGLLEDVYLVDDGLIQSITENPEVQDANTGEAWEAFRQWVIANHSSDVNTMYDTGAARLTPESIALWERYTEEFVASLE